MSIKQSIKEFLRRNIIIPIVVNVQKSQEAARINNIAFCDLKNKYEGKRDIVICGAGPSLNQYKMIPDADHMALNRAFIQQGIEFDYIVAQDYVGIKAYEKELINYRREKCIKFLSSQRVIDEKTIPESLLIKCNARKICTDGYLKRGYSTEFVCNIDERAIGGMPNVALTAFQIALFMNPRRIYLVGIDLSGGHFSNKNLEQEEARRLDDRYNKILQDSLVKKWYEAKKFQEVLYPDVEVVSVNPVALKGIFKDKYM